MTWRTAFKALLSAAVLAAFLFLATGPGWTHDPYTGLKNAKGELCCYGGPSGDCRQLADGDVATLPDGYWVKSVGRLVPYDRAQPSINDKFHLCLLAGRVRCFLAPEGGV